MDERGDCRRLWRDRRLGSALAALVRQRRRRGAPLDHRAGSLAGPDPRLLLFLTIGLVNWGAAAPQLRRMILGDDYPADRYREAIAAATRALARG